MVWSRALHRWLNGRRDPLGRGITKIVGRERNQRACHRQLVRNVVARRRVNSIVMRFSHFHMKLVFGLMLCAAPPFGASAYAQTKPCPPEVICDPMKFDEYGTLAWSDEKARLDNAAITLQRESPDIVMF